MLLAAAGLVMVLAGLGAFYATDDLSIFSIANLVAGPAALLVAGVLELRRLRGFTGVHSRRVVLRFTALVLAVASIAALANYGLRGWSARLDFTADRVYTLSDQTVLACAEFDAASDPSGAQLLFFEDSLLARDVALLVDAYRGACKKLEVREMAYANAPAQCRPVLAQYEATVLLATSETCDPIGYPDEQNITNALIRLARDRNGRSISVHFLVGHGEVDLASDGEHGFSGLTGQLRELGIDVRAHVGSAHSAISDEADVLVIAAPERNLLDAELSAINAYMERGGRVLFLVEPGVNSNANEIIERWGFAIPDTIVADRSTSPLLRDPDAISLLIHSFNPLHDITRPLSNRTMVLWPGARPVLRVRKPAPEDDLQNLLYASRRAWAETDVTGALAGRAVEPDSDEAPGAELAIGGAGRYPRGEAEARLVVLGDRDFASNRLIGALYNRDILINAILWLAEDTQRIALLPKMWTRYQDPLTLQQTVAYFYFLAFALPEMLLLVGIWVWYRNRG